METQMTKFLLAEDDEDHAEIVIYNLKKTKIVNQIDHVTDGEQVLRYLKKEAPFEDKERPDVILLDLNMPKLNGHEVLEKLKDHPDLSSIPVVMLTTSNAESDRIKAYGYHVNSYLVKPMSFDKFAKMIEDLSFYWGVWNRPAQNTETTTP